MRTKHIRQKLHERAVVVYEDPDLVILEKSAGLLSYPVEHQRDDSAIQLIRRYWKSLGITNRNLYLLHRLDRETSGLMIFAKTTLARKSLTAQFFNHSVVRGYFAVTDGVPKPEQGVLRITLGRTADGRRGVSKQGQLSITRYDVQRSTATRALVYCSLHTGRTHQVRIHMAHLGCPVVGDSVYGKIKSERMMLHACVLGFLHPRTNRPHVFTSSLPESFRKALK